jgi:hypothetical protein
MFDKVNKVILIKKKLIRNLNLQIIEFRSKIKESETQIGELKNKNYYESHLGEIGLLKVKL